MIIYGFLRHRLQYFFASVSTEYKDEEWVGSCSQSVERIYLCCCKDERL